MRNLLLAGMIAVGLAGTAHATNLPAPAGTVIFNLDGQTLPHSYATYNASFTATSTTTNLSFAFRDDPTYFNIDNISLTTAGGPNLIVNGDFAQGPLGSSTPTGFTYLNLNNATAAGVVSLGCGVNLSFCYRDGAVGSYDSITQSVATTVGAQYNLSFALMETGTQAVASALTTATLSGINLVVYAGALPTTSVPEPASLALLGMGVASLVAMRRRTARPAAIA